MISQNKKIIILFVVGITFLSLGGYRIISSYFEFDYILFQLNQEVSTPELKRLHVSIPPDTPSSFEWININFYAEDVFAAGFPIYYDIHVKIREPNEIANLYLVLREPDNRLSWINSTNVIKFLETEHSLGNIIKITQINPTEFKISQETTFPSTHEYGLSIIANSKNFGTQPVDLIGETLLIEPAAKKISINNDRIANLTDSYQLKSNYVTEGFSAIIVGWIPIELGIQLMRERNRILSEKRKTINAVISELENIRNYIDSRQSTILTQEGTIYRIDGVKLSNNGINILISTGIYQELENKLQLSISDLYQRVSICNDFVSLLNQTLIFQMDSDKLSRKLEALANTYENTMKTIRKDLAEIIFSLKKLVPS